MTFLLKSIILKTYKRRDLEHWNYNDNQPDQVVDFRIHDELKPINLPVNRPSKGLFLLKLTTIFVVGFFGLFLFMTAPSQWVRLEYSIAEAKGGEPVKVIDTKNKSFSFSEAIFSSLSADKLFKAKGPSIKIDEGELVVPKIGVRAPIAWNSSFADKDLKENLANGLAHYEGSILPNDKAGNVFVTGHSSDYWWNKGSYKTVFALLDKLVVGDQAMIKFQGRVFVYEVSKLFVVSPEQIEVVSYTDNPILSLMTCTPVGTAINRLIVQFELVAVFED